MIGSTNLVVGMGHSIYMMEDRRKENPSGVGCTNKHQQKEHEEQSARCGKPMLELEPYEAEAGPNNPDAGTTLIDLQHTFLLRMLCEYFAHGKRVVFDCSAAAPVKTYKAFFQTSRNTIRVISPSQS